MDYSLPGSSVHLIFLARILEWFAISINPHENVHFSLGGWVSSPNSQMKEWKGRPCGSAALGEKIKLRKVGEIAKGHMGRKWKTYDVF